MYLAATFTTLFHASRTRWFPNLVTTRSLTRHRQRAAQSRGGRTHQGDAWRRRAGGFTHEDAEELVRYAVRRGLIGPDEGDRVLGEVQVALKSRRKVVKSAKPKAAKKRPAKKKFRR